MALGKVDVDGTVTTPDITRAVLSYFKGIPPVRAMFHDKVPMEAYGRWSWCPPSLFDLDNLGRSIVTQPVSKTYNLSTLHIGQEGLASARFFVLSVRPGDLDALQLCSSHISISAKVHDALENPETCLLLKECHNVHVDPERHRASSVTPSIAPSLLVQPVNWQGTSQYRRAKVGWADGERISDPWAKEEHVKTRLEKARHGRPLARVMTEEPSLFCLYVACVLSRFPTDIQTPVLHCLVGEDIDDFGLPFPIVNAEDEIRNIVQEALSPPTQDNPTS